VTSIGSVALLAEGRQLNLASDTAIAIITVDAALLAEALADAERYRRGHAAEPCTDCETAPAGACEKHLDDLDQADAYRDLAAGFAGGRCCGSAADR
jgi:hypothetical protein